MAEKNDKPSKVFTSNPIRSERHLTVSSLPVERKNKTWPYSIQTKVPWIRMQGKWLEEAGFGIDTPIKVRVIKGCLVLTVE